MPKNIVLLSDGTGNSAAKLLKTNVWRIYEGLKLTDPSQQVACYDDGVGTSSFKPLAILGGAFGVGLRRNVLRLYRFLCEHYDPGDRIYLFGFSRGAFTIRVLAGMICDQGVIKTRPTMKVAGATAGPVVRDVTVPRAAAGREPLTDTPVVDPDAFAYGSELARRVKWAYRDFRKRFKDTSFIVTAARFLRDVVLGTSERIRGQRPYNRADNHDVPKIRFVGVWDTVDAYGTPVDELTEGIDRWVWPLSMPDLELSPKVERACHVLALDDERNTFHPVLWDESKERQDATCLKDERISQVWFSGMHSNVGGGYPDDALSYVSLTWMVEQATRCDLDFEPTVIHQHVLKADVLGRLYDSRSGLKAYYRYNPRRIEWLTNGQAHERRAFGGRPGPRLKVIIERPKIHESVFARMAAAPEAYAPIVLPSKYAVVMADGRILDADDNPFEPSAAVTRRAEAQEGVWNDVWWKRLWYFATVAVTVVLVALPFMGLPRLGVAIGGPGRLVRTVGAWLPSYVAPWIGFYEEHPMWLLTLGGAALLFQWFGVTLQSSICTSMRRIWLMVLPPAMDEYTRLPRPRSKLLSIRLSAWYQGFYAVLRRVVTPNVFGIAVLVCIFAAVNRAAFEAAGAIRPRCVATVRSTLAVGEEREVPQPFYSNDFCFATGITLEAGAKYRVQLRLHGDWADGGISVSSPSGLSLLARGLTLSQRATFAGAVPFRRSWTAGWFAVIAVVGEQGDQYMLTDDAAQLTALTTGELFLFVNDAIAPLKLKPISFGWRSYYSNNSGEATVIVKKLSEP